MLGLLGDRLSTEARTAVRESLVNRIIRPVQASIRLVPPTRGVFKNFWMNANSNWNSVCWSGTVMAASIALDDKTERATIYANAFKNGNNYLNVFTSDGWDTEGAMYWNLGFGEYIMLREAMLRVTKNNYDMFKDPNSNTASSAVQTSSRFPYWATLFTREDGVAYGPDFGDCPPS